MTYQRRWIRSRWLRTALTVLLSLGPLVLQPRPLQAQSTGDCVIIPCGPSGLFTRDVLPTTAGIDFSAFPTNPSRPYVPGGRMWYVRSTGSDQADGTTDHPVATVNRAVALAQAGDAIQVADGTYRLDGDQGSGVVLDKPGVTLFAEHSGLVTLLPASDEVQHGIEVRADDLIVDGFIIRGFSHGDGILYGRIDRPQRNLVFKNLLIDGADIGIGTVFNEGGTQNPQPLARGMLLNHVTIRNANLIGFDCGQGPCQDVRADNLVVQMHGGYEDSGADAVAMESGDNILVFNADISGASADGIDLKATRVAAINVIVHDIGRNGIKFWRGGDIVNALVYNTGADAAVVLDGGGTYRLLHTVVARHNYKDPGSAYAMTAGYDQSDAPGKLAIQNSVFYQNSGAAWVSGTLTLDVRNSLFFGSGNGQEVVWAHGDGDRVYGEDEQPVQALEQAGGGCCNIGFVDPQFTNADKADYTLRPDSPAIDRGAVDLDAAPDFDLRGRPRPTGKAPDLGPIER